VSPSLLLLFFFVKNGFPPFSKINIFISNFLISLSKITIHIHFPSMCLLSRHWKQDLWLPFSKHIRVRICRSNFVFAVCICHHRSQSFAFAITIHNRSQSHPTSPNYSKTLLAAPNRSKPFTTSSLFFVCSFNVMFYVRVLGFWSSEPIFLCFLVLHYGWDLGF